MKSAFGIKLTLDATGYHGELPTGETVRFWKTAGGWEGHLACGGHVFVEPYGCASPQACYRSMRGQVANLRNALTKALEVRRG